mmetsp:Transcript_79762/g.133575  ORF Transcript_79762/g.133575 Transcript_79762/m.133575 type:complete len:93 (+) Transcript_79762:356-634(+)
MLMPKKRCVRIRALAKTHFGLVNANLPQATHLDTLGPGTTANCQTAPTQQCQLVHALPASGHMQMWDRSGSGPVIVPTAGRAPLDRHLPTFA